MTDKQFDAWAKVNPAVGNLKRHHPVHLFGAVFKSSKGVYLFGPNTPCPKGTQIKLWNGEVVTV